MKNLIEKLDQLGQSHSIKNEELESLKLKFGINDLELSSYNKDLVCGFVPEKEDDESEDDSEEEIKFN